MLEITDAVGAAYGIDPVSTLLLDPDAPGVDVLAQDAPERLMLAIFAAGTTGHAILSTVHGVSFDVFLGHSFGEIAALTAAGAFTVENGARVLCLRSEALRSSPPPPGGLIALPSFMAGTSEERFRGLSREDCHETASSEVSAGGLSSRRV
ncbi:acyltransferase domain-containing protein [Amycolatopsis sp. NPDC059090]|uniref:acyltransferase domain-containing protein n=1 Tax=unclassified Amycolatopsis TaxID=2618356 RepID=UPI00366E2EE2